MPRFDGTGPSGSGPRTGWGMGCCGFRRFASKKNTVLALEEEEKFLQEELEAVRREKAALKGQEEN